MLTFSMVALLPLAIWLNCSQANTLIARLIAHNLPPQQEAALIKEIKSVSSRACEWRM
jgi:siroheme synthase